MRIIIINEHVNDKLGGSEIQCDLIARKLVDFGHEVIYLAVKGVNRLYNTPYKVLGVSLEQQDEFDQVVSGTRPDVVYWRYNKKWFAESMKVAARHQVPVIFSVSHKYDIQKNRTDLLLPEGDVKKTLKNWRRFFENRKQFNGFRHVDAISNQCRDFMGVSGVKHEIYFPNSVSRKSVPFQWDKPYCLWASSIKKRKNPEAYIRLAKMMQNENLDFIMAGEIQDSSYSYLNYSEKLPPNLHYVGLKSYEEINGMLKAGLFLIHTCNPEGFPNNFIQAWAFGKPVVSLYYDPDHLIEKNKLGFYSRTFEQFKEDVKKLVNEPGLRNEMGENGKVLSQELFDPEKNVKKLEKLMLGLIGKN